MEHKKRDIIIYFDIDGVLITDTELYRDKAFLGYLNQNMDRIKFGICSARSTNSALGIYKAMKLNGPFIAENGACYMLDSESGLTAVEEGTSVIPELLEKFSAKHNDVVTSKERLHSGTLHFKKEDEEFFELTKNRLADHFSKKDFSYRIKKVAENKLAVNLSTTHKIRAIEKIGGSASSYLISDQEEAVPDTSVGLICLSDAQPEFKQICEYIAPSIGVRGLIEAINYILQKERINGATNSIPA